MSSSTRDVGRLGQVFTPEAVVRQMLAMRRNQGRTLEPSAGDGAFARHLPGCVAIELDRRVAPPGALIMDFFDYPQNERFDTIIGNPPYVRHQDIPEEVKGRLDLSRFDGRANLYLFFIEKCVHHLNPGGELIFIVPREFVKLTAARRLNEFLFQEGSITDFVETGDAPIFAGHAPNCAIFRFERGRTNRLLRDGRRFTLIDGQLMFLRSDHSLPLADIFSVKVGAVSGADDIFTHARGNCEFVSSKTIDTGLTRRMLFNVNHPHLLANKGRLLARRIRPFDESNWWQWGRVHHVSDAPRIYVNAKTRRKNPFFVHPCPNYDGSVLALFPHAQAWDLHRLAGWLNTHVDWEELGFVCDGRFLFSQRTLQSCLLPQDASALLDSCRI